MKNLRNKKPKILAVPFILGIIFIYVFPSIYLLTNEIKNNENIGASYINLLNNNIFSEVK